MVVAPVVPTWAPDESNSLLPVREFLRVQTLKNDVAVISWVLDYPISIVTNRLVEAFAAEGVIKTTVSEVPGKKNHAYGAVHVVQMIGFGNGHGLLNRRPRYDFQGV